MLNKMDEYVALRAEIKDWQDRRFTILTAAIGLVAAILGLKVFDQPASTELAVGISVLLLLLLTSACVLTWYAGRANAKIAAYIVVFHERSGESGSGWESRLADLKNKKLDPDRLNLNQVLISIYFVLGLVSVFYPLWQHLPCGAGLGALPAAVAVFFWSLGLLCMVPQKERYIEQWELLKQSDRH